MSRIPTSKRSLNSITTNNNNENNPIIPNTASNTTITTNKISFIQPFAKTSRFSATNNNSRMLLKSKNLLNNNNNKDKIGKSDIITQTRRTSPRISLKEKKELANKVQPTSGSTRTNDLTEIESEQQQESNLEVRDGNTSIPTPPNSQTPTNESGSGAIKTISSQVLSLPSSSIPISTSTKGPSNRKPRVNLTSLRPPSSQSQSQTQSSTAKSRHSLTPNSSNITTPLSRKKSVTPSLPPNSNSQTSTQKKSSTKPNKPKPRPSETLPFAPHPHPQFHLLDNSNESNTLLGLTKNYGEDDPLLLRGGEEMRGWGEGNFRDREERSRSRSVSVAVNTTTTTRRERRKSENGRRRKSSVLPVLVKDDNELENEANLLEVDTRFSDEEELELPIEQEAEEEEEEEVDDIDLKRQRINSPTKLQDWSEFDLAPLGSGGMSTSEIGDLDHEYENDQDLGGYEDYGGFASDDGSEFGADIDANDVQAHLKDSSPATTTTSRDYFIPLRAQSSSPPLSSLALSNFQSEIETETTSQESQIDLMQLSTPPRSHHSYQQQQQQRPSSPFIRLSQIDQLADDDDNEDNKGDSIDITISSPFRVQSQPQSQTLLPPSSSSSSSSSSSVEVEVEPMEIGVKIELIEEWSFSLEKGGNQLNDDVEEEEEVVQEERIDNEVEMKEIVVEVESTEVAIVEKQEEEEEEEIILLVGSCTGSPTTTSRHQLIRRSLSPLIASSPAPPPIRSLNDSIEFSPSPFTFKNQGNRYLSSPLTSAPQVIEVPKMMESPQRQISILKDIKMSSPSPKRVITTPSSPFPPTPPPYHHSLPFQSQVQPLTRSEIETQTQTQSPPSATPFIFTLPTIIQQDTTMGSPSPKRGNMMMTSMMSRNELLPNSIQRVKESGLMERFREIVVEKEKEVARAEEELQVEVQEEERQVKVEEDDSMPLSISTAIISAPIQVPVVVENIVVPVAPTFTVSTSTSVQHSTPIVTSHLSQHRSHNQVQPVQQSRSKSLFTPLSTISHQTQTQTQIQNQSSLRASSRKSAKKPTHPTLPIVEISSTDPKAAARAAAILKVHHDYVEQGLEIPNRLLVEAGMNRGVSRNAEQEWKEEDGEGEEELKELLGEAEVEVLKNVSGQYSVSRSIVSKNQLGSIKSSGRRIEMASPTPSGMNQSRAGSNHLASRSQSIISSIAPSNLAVQDSTSPTSSSSSSLKVITSPLILLDNNNMMTSSSEREWTSVEWRKLERALVDEKRAAKKDGRELVLEDIIWEFLENEGAGEEDCVGEWDWEKLITRIKVLQSRRARESSKQPSSKSCSSGTTATTQSLPSLDAELQTASVRESLLEPEEEEDEDDDDEEVLQVQVKMEELDDEELAEQEDDEEEELASLSTQRSIAEVQYDSFSESEDGFEDTFFQQLRNTSVTSKAIIHQEVVSEEEDEEEEEEEEVAFVHPPLSLASFRFAHLYDEPIEKPAAPAASRLGTPEPTGSGSNSTSSSARKLFSYLGSLVKRSPALSSPASSAGYSSPEVSEVSIIYETNTNPIPINFSHLFPQSSPAHPSPLRKIRRLPISSANVTSLPFQSTTTPILRRRSSGIGGSGGSGAGGRVWDQVEKVEIAEQKEEEELRNSGGKRRAQTELRREGRVYGASPAMIPSGTRALDRPFGLKAEPRRIF